MPPRPVDHRARFDGWNLDPRWREAQTVFDGQKYDMIFEQTTPLKGERPIIGWFGGNTLGQKSAGVQFAESNKKLVGASLIFSCSNDSVLIRFTLGADVMAGKSYPVSGVVEALGYAYSGALNDSNPTAVALPCLSVVRNRDTAVVVGANDEFVQAALSKNILYGAYHNIISTVGTSAVWGGVVAPYTADSSSTPSVVVKGLAARSTSPANLAFAPSTFFFYEKGTAKSKISVEDAVKK